MEEVRGLARPETLGEGTGLNLHCRHDCFMEEGYDEDVFLERKAGERQGYRAVRLLQDSRREGGKSAVGRNAQNLSLEADKFKPEIHSNCCMTSGKVSMSLSFNFLKL